MEDGNGPPASCPFWSALSPNTKWEEEENPVSFAFFISPFIQPLFSFFFFFHRNTCDSFGPRTGRKTPKKNEEREREETVKDTSERRRKRFFFFFFSNLTKRRHCTVCFQRGRRCPSVRQTAVITDTLRSSTGRIPPHRITARDSARPATQSTSVWRIRQMGRKRDEEKNRKFGFSLTCKCVDFGG